MGHVSDALIIVGLVTLITGGVFLAVNAIRKRFRRTWKRWTVVAVSGLALLLAGAFVGSLPAQFEVTSFTVKPKEVMPGERLRLRGMWRIRVKRKESITQS